MTTSTTEYDQSANRLADIEQAREQYRTDLAEHHAKVTAYLDQVEELGTVLPGLLDRFSALTDDLTAVTAPVDQLDRQQQVLAARGRTLGEPAAPGMPVIEAVVQRLREDPRDGILLQRLLMASRRSRSTAVACLTDMAQRLRPGR